MAQRGIVLWDQKPPKNTLFTLRKVRQSPLLSRVACLPSEAFCDGHKHVAALAVHKRHSAILSQLDFIARAAFPPLRRENTTKSWSKTKCVWEQTSVIIQIKKKRQSLVSDVSAPLRHLAVWNTSLSCVAQTQTFAPS